MKHRGMIHIHLVVRDLARSQHFYEQAFGLVELMRHDEERMVFLQTPGAGDVVTLLYSGFSSPGYVLAPQQIFAHVAEPGYSVFMGTAPASGVLVLEVAPFDISAQSLSFYGQALYVNLTETGLTNPIQLHILNGEAKRPQQSGPTVGTATRRIF